MWDPSTAVPQISTSIWPVVAIVRILFLYCQYEPTYLPSGSISLEGQCLNFPKSEADNKHQVVLLGTMGTKKNQSFAQRQVEMFRFAYVKTQQGEWHCLVDIKQDPEVSHSRKQAIEPFVRQSGGRNRIKDRFQEVSKANEQDI